MFYEKKFSVDKPTRKRYRLSSFKGYDPESGSGTLPRDYCDEVYNFGFENNTLTGGIGLKRFTYRNAAGEDESVRVISSDCVNPDIFFGKLSDENGPFECIMATSDEYLLYVRLGKSSQWLGRIKTGRRFTSAISYLYGDDNLMLLGGGGEGIYVVSETEDTYVADALTITDLCTHYERVYAVVEGVRTSVWFSDAFDPYNWNVSLDEGGYISLDGSLGEVLRVLSFQDYVYIFCEYGIYRLTAYSDQLQFSIKRLHCDCGRIYKDTITSCGAFVAFVTSDGVYALDGYDVTRLTDKLDDLLEGSKDHKAVFCDGKYYLSFDVADEERAGKEELVGLTEKGADVLAVVDTEKGTAEIYRGLNIRSMCVMSGTRQHCVLAVTSASNIVMELVENGCSFDMLPTLKYWAVKDVDFNEHMNKKYIVGVDYCTKKPFTLGVVADKKVREFRADPDKKYMPIGVSGTCFDFYIKSTEQEPEIKPFGVTVDFLRRGL